MWQVPLADPGLGVLQKPEPLVMEFNTYMRVWVRMRARTPPPHTHTPTHPPTQSRRSCSRIQGKVEQSYTCLPIHTNEVSQLIKDSAYKLQNGCCFTATLHIFPIRVLWLALPETCRQLVQPRQLEHCKATSYFSLKLGGKINII